MDLQKQFIKIISLSFLFLLLNTYNLFSQTCDCTVTNPTYTVSGNSNTAYVLSTGKTLLITSSGNYTGKVTLSGGAIINAGTFTPANTSTFPSGTITNCNILTFSFSPFVYNFVGPIPLTINNCQTGKISVINNSNFYNHGTFNNYGYIEVTNGNFGSFHNATNYSSGYIKESGGSSNFYRNDGFLVNKGFIEVLSQGDCFNQGSVNNTGRINIAYNFVNQGTIYTECSININGNLTNQGTFNGPTTAGKRGRVNVNGSTSNLGHFTETGYMDLCSTGGRTGIYTNTTFCQNSGTGCTNDQITVTITPPSAGVCNGKCVSLTANVSGAMGTLTYSWSPNIGSTSTVNACPVTTTTYTVTVTSTAGQTGTATATVTINTSPVANAGPDLGTCTGKTVTIGGTPTASAGTAPYTYAWTPATGLSSTTVANPIANPGAISYTVTVTDAKGCTATDAVSLTLVNNCCDPAGITAGPDQKICKWANAKLQASGGTTYLWAPASSLSNNSIPNPVAFPTATTTYTVTITRVGCNQPFTDEVVVEVLDKGAPDAGADRTICAGQSVQLLATGGTSYEWSPTAGLSNAFIANPIATPAVTTVYKVKATGPNVCPVQNTDEVLIVVTNTPVITTSGNTVNCGGSGVQISASGGTTYSWLPVTGLSNPSIANPIANPTVTTTYTVTVSNGPGCSGTGTVTVYTTDDKDVTVTADQSTCSGNPVQLSATGGVNYVWSPAQGLSCTTCANPLATPATTTKYQVTITLVNGCTVVKEVSVVVNTTLTVNAGPDVNICPGDKVDLFANSSGALDFSWQPTSGLSCDKCPNPSATVLTTTIYTVTVTNNNCVAKDYVTITVNPAFSAAINSSIQNCIVHFAATPNGLSKYEWDFGDNTFFTGQTVDHTYPQTGIYRVVLTVTDSCGPFKVYRYVKIFDCSNGDRCN